MNIDDLQNRLNRISRYQIFIIFAISVNSFGFAITAYSGSILSAVPSHRCLKPRDAIEPKNDTTNIPTNHVNESYYACVAVDGDLPCTTGWEYSAEFYQETTVSEWDLVCSRKYLDSIANSLFFAGFFFGSAVSGLLSDWFGRKFTMVLFVLLVSTANISASFVKNYIVYVALRFLAGGAAIGLRLAGYTLCIELLPTQYRTIATVAIVSFGDVMVVAMSVCAYFVRHWRTFYFIVGISTLPCLVLLFFVPKSPRWLLSKNKPDEAKQIMEKIFKSKGMKVDEASWDEITSKNFISESNEMRNKRTFYSDLFRRPMMRIVTLNVMFGWFVGSLVVYGLVLNITNLTGDPYINAILNSLMGVASNILVYFSKHIGRRRTLAVSYGMAGFCCIFSTILSLIECQDTLVASVGFALVGRFFASAAFVTILLVTSEVFPTPIYGKWSEFNGSTDWWNYNPLHIAVTI